jgi:hypothetical protein
MLAMSSVYARRSPRRNPFCGYFSARYSTIATDSLSTKSPIDENGNLAGGIHGQKLRPAVLAPHEVDLDVLEIEVQLRQHPTGHG